MELRPGYKQTEVGVIPEDWEVRELESFAKVTSGKRLPMGYFVSDTVTPHPYIRVTDMRPGWVDTSDLKYVPVVAFPPIKNYRIFRDELFISVAGTLGIVGKIPKELDGANLTENANRISAIECDKGYLLHVMLSPVVQEVIESEQTVGAQPKLALMRIRNFSIPLPPTAVEQSAIATALGDVDALLAAQDALIAKKRAIKQGAMQELLTGKRRLPGFSGEWEVKRLGRLLESPVTDGPHLTPKFLDRGVPFLSVNNLVDGRIDWSDLRYISDVDHREFSRKCRPRKGDILFGKAASVGMVAFVESEIEFNIWSPIALIRVAPQFSAKFVYHQLQSGFVEKQVLLLTNSSSQGNIGMGDIERLEIAYPSSRDEQVAIAALLDDLDCEIASLETNRAKTAMLKQGMMQELLTGRIRLV